MLVGVVPPSTGVRIKGYDPMGMDEDAVAAYKRGRSGRPIQRIRTYIRTHGTHVCWICGECIDTTLPDTHRYSWTIDHVLPLSLYPHMGMDMDNMREAHRTCNSSKGNRDTTSTKTSRNW